MYKNKTYTLIDCIRFVHESSPFYVLFLLLFTVVEAFLSSGGVVMAMSKVMEIVQDVVIHHSVSSTMLWPIGGLFLLLATVRILSVWIHLLTVRMRIRLEQVWLPQLLEFQAQLRIQDLESEEIYEQIDYLTDEFCESIMDSIQAMLDGFVVMIQLISPLLVVVQLAKGVIGVLIGCMIPLVVVAIKNGEKIYAVRKQSRSYEHLYSYYSDEILLSNETKEERTLFQYAPSMIQRYHREFQKAFFNQLGIVRIVDIRLFVMNAAFLGVMSGVIGVLLQLYGNGLLSVELLLSISSILLVQCRSLASEVQHCAQLLSEGKEYMRDLTTLFNLSVVEGSTDDRRPIETVVGQIVFHHVSFRYPNSEQYCLKNVSFSFEYGKKYAIVGENGAGKSTIIKLLTKLYEDYEGEIWIDGIELRAIPYSKIKSIFTVAYQDYAKYFLSIKDSLSIGDESLSKEKMIQMMQYVGLDTLYQKVDGRLDTPLGRLKEDGIELSGGEWQKLMLARTLLRKSPFLILDEPTAALDPFVEREFYQKIFHSSQYSSLITITHRLATTVMADEILVFKEGQLVEQGTHEELLEKQDYYAEMFEEQKKWYQ